MSRKIRYGMIGGGRGAFIGAVHRIAAAIDGQIDLVCGAVQLRRRTQPGFRRRPFSSAGTMLRIVRGNDRRSEAALPKEQRMDFVAIVTPNHVHLPAAQMALQHGFHVLSDKPATLNLAQAKKLRQWVQKTGLLYGLTYTYTGYPLVKEARSLVRSGKLGKVRKVVVEYPQGWFNTLLEATGMKQAVWRTDPKQCGAGGCVGDIGTHAENLVHYITGAEIKELAADATIFVKGRRLDDDINVLIRLDNGAKGVLHASQISVGEENNLNISPSGAKSRGGLADGIRRSPHTMLVKWPGPPNGSVSHGLRLFGGRGQSLHAHPATAALHPEGLPGGSFANIYRNFANHIRAFQEGRTPAVDDPALDYPRIDDGVAGGWRLLTRC